MTEEHELKLLKLELFNKLTAAAIELLSHPEIALVTDKLNIETMFVSDEAKIKVLVEHKDHGHGYAFSMHFDNDMNLILTNVFSDECIITESITQNLIEL